MKGVPILLSKLLSCLFFNDVTFSPLDVYRLDGVVNHISVHTRYKALCFHKLPDNA